MLGPDTAPLMLLSPLWLPLPATFGLLPDPEPVCIVWTQDSISDSLQYLKKLHPNCIRRFVITEKAPTRAFSWLKAPTSAFTFKTLC